MPFFKTPRGLDWHYEVNGGGDTIVMIHGFGGSSYFWQAQKDFLHTDFQVLTIDLPGHGKSAWMPVNLTEMAVDIHHILNSLGISQFSIIASSMGGLIALSLYRMGPENIMRMSLVGSIPKFAQAPSYPAGLDALMIRELQKRCDGNYKESLDIFFRSLFTRKERESDRFKWVKDMRNKEPLPQQAAARYFLDIIEKADLRDRIASMICPLQFITGTDDYICPRAVMDWVAMHTHNARFDFMEGCGHLPFLTQVDEYNRLVEDFLLN